ncbi:MULTISPECIES: penicillin-binding protein 2 [unclassified Bacillus (in: firmicutes)]|uniref:peptidoglycan D,D-transpeptidase FtsI family protein n=1 Tax=unclassified Bacillus (in: firmicutes) TaxID=185979 RepID=UPI0008DEE90A|nr:MULTISPECIES: penicillin-binding transpeptidase domain-containing protein [unclassified Bacillus (in: firmicutes)]SFA95041.1 Cell division protein FtsI/penicillin-binding protein 2 [Bacillus sp. UNCCL13]SFQ78848.1 Cell division protein FtsI/penicillin-binding protein 2 [Bacillus sp. cl95]
MWRKRALGMVIFCLIGFSLLLARLAEIQLISTESFSKHNVNLLEASVRQRSQEMVIDNGRGNFLDRNGESLTHTKIPVLILFPFLSRMEWDVEKVAEITGVHKEDLIDSIKNAKDPFAFGDPEPVKLTTSQMEKINALRIPGVFAVERKYEKERFLAEQLIGLVRENPKELLKRYPDKELAPETLIGVSGMESSFDEFLLPEGKSKLVFHVDGDGAPLFGINVKYVDPANPFYPVNIRTTIDRELQDNSEKLVDQYGIKRGGLVLLDIESNSILAMVSKPSVNKNNPFDGAGLTNMMLKQQIAGSVFKTVVAAAAIDYNLDDPGRTFDCSRKLNGKPDLKYNHGMLNFEDSFARSCNQTFGQLAKDLKDIDPDILENYAKKLGVIGRVGWEGPVFHTSNFKQLPEEDVGRVFLSDDAKRDDNFVALSGIGQHEVRVTPLAVANMMATIARGGKKESVRASSKIEYKNGTTMIDFDKTIIKGDSIAPYTAMNLQRLLREVVLNEKGTGRWFKDLPLEVAGKSGTAETGVFVDKKQLHNKWFAGYFPYQNPKYALVTVNLDVFEDEGGVNPLFADMVKMIAENDMNK